MTYESTDPGVRLDVMSVRLDALEEETASLEKRFPSWPWILGLLLSLAGSHLFFLYKLDREMRTEREALELRTIERNLELVKALREIAVEVRENRKAADERFDKIRDRRNR